MPDNVAGLMNKPKYSHNTLRTGELGFNAPYTVLISSVSNQTIRMPLPQNINSSLNIDWQQQQVSLGMYALKHGGIDVAKSIKDQIMAHPVAAVSNMLDVGKSAFKHDTAQLLARAKNENSQIHGPKIIMNPRNEMMFNGVNFRSYSFIFSLVPMSEDDSKNIQKVIGAIQNACVPELLGVKMFMEYPETWKIFFMDSGEYLMKINECCCTRVDVNYTPQGTAHQTHKNNAPIAVELSLDFTEVVIPSKENTPERKIQTGD